MKTKEEAARDAVNEANERISKQAEYVQPQRRPRNFRKMIDRMIDSVPTVK